MSDLWLSIQPQIVRSTAMHEHRKDFLIITTRKIGHNRFESKLGLNEAK